MPAVFWVNSTFFAAAPVTKAEAKRQKTEEGFVARPAQEPVLFGGSSEVSRNKSWDETINEDSIITKR